MNDTLLREKNQVTLPADVVEAAALVPARDRISWRFEAGEIRGVKTQAVARQGRVTKDPKTGLLYWRADITAEEAEAAALAGNLDRE